MFTDTEVDPPVPAQITMTLVLSTEEAKLLRAVCSARPDGSREFLEGSMREACVFAPATRDAKRASELLYQLGDRLTEALTKAEPNETVN